MSSRMFIPALALACLIPLGCDRAPTHVVSPGSPSSITNGELDGNAHPAVVLVLMDVGGRPAFLCSGTLIAPKVVLTAGHCAGEPGEFSGIRIYTESDVDNGNNNFPIFAWFRTGGVQAAGILRYTSFVAGRGWVSVSAVSATNRRKVF